MIVHLLRILRGVRHDLAGRQDDRDPQRHRTRQVGAGWAQLRVRLAVKQVEAGAKAVDVNLGPRKKDFAEVIPWIYEAIETVVDVPLCIDSTNIEAIELRLPEADIADKASAGQNSLVVKIHTDEGLTGIGEIDSHARVAKAAVDGPFVHSVCTGLARVMV